MNDGCNLICDETKTPDSVGVCTCVCSLTRRQGQTVTFSQRAFDTYHTGLVTAELISMHNYSSISDI